MHVNGKAEKYELTVKTHLEYYRGLLMKVFLCIIGHLMYTFSSICVLSVRIWRNAVYSKSHDNVPADSCGLSY